MHEHLPLSRRIEMAELAVQDSDIRLRQRLAYARQNLGKGVRGQIVGKLRSWAGIALGVAAAGATMWVLWPRRRALSSRVRAGGRNLQHQGRGRAWIGRLVPVLPLALSALNRSGFMSPNMMSWASLASSLIAVRSVPK